MTKSITERDEKGRFAQGNSGGPGRPKGRGYELQRAAQEAVTAEHLTAMMRKAMRLALEGNLSADWGPAHGSRDRAQTCKIHPGGHMEEQGTVTAHSESSWTDTQKHLIETTVKITGWGVAAGFIFAGWLMTEQALDWTIKPGTCVLVIVATIACSTAWHCVVRGAARACHDAFPASPTTADIRADDPTRMVRRTPTLSLAVGIIVVLVTTLACFDDLWDTKPKASAEVHTK